MSYYLVHCKNLFNLDYKAFNTMKKTLISLNNFHFECNDHLLNSILPFENIDPVVHELYSHIINAHSIWMDRLLDRPARFDVWDLHDPESYSKLVFDNYMETNDLLLNLSEEDLETTHKYKNSKGTEFENTKGDTLLHIFNHTTHHRGQIIMKLRADDIEIPVTDYVFLKRQKVE